MGLMENWLKDWLNVFNILLVLMMEIIFDYFCNLMVWSIIINFRLVWMRWQYGWSVLRGLLQKSFC